MTNEELIFPTVVNLVANFIIHFGNINIILATIYCKNLQHPCNYLIALNALTDSLISLSYYIFSYFLFSGILYANLLSCYYYLIVPSFAGQWSIALTLAIGIDRMFGVVMPLRYHRYHKSKLYISIVLFLSLMYVTWFMYTNFLYILTTPNDTIICFITSVTHPGFYVYKNIGQGIVCGSILASYSITWLVVSKKKNDNKSLKQILKPLTMIMFMVVFSWPLTILLVSIARQFVPPQQTLTVILYLVWINNFCKALDYFIFFAFSKDYRKAFLRQLSWVPYFGKFAQPQVYLVKKVFFKSMVNPLQSLKT